MSFYSSLPTSPVYDALSRKLAMGDCVLVDGGVATELERARGEAAGDREPWGVWALYSAQTAVLDVHRRYVAAGCDVLSTNSWSILEEAETWDATGPSPAWESAADAALRLAKKATAEASRQDDCAVAFCINGELGGERALGALELLTWRWQEDAPDLVVFETLDELPSEPVLDAVRMVAEFGLPVWVSMRRGEGGMASPEGRVFPDQHPEALSTAVRALEDSGVSALLVNCVPRQLVSDAVTSLAGASSVPVGCLPNLGRPRSATWEFDRTTTPEAFADEALEWIESGAQIIGGCCGVGPEHIAATRHVLESATAWSARGV